jgi:hypothetical protein
MDSPHASDAPRHASLPPAPSAPHRIVIPLRQVLDFARNEPDFHPSRRVAFALRPLLELALATAGLCQRQAATPAASPGSRPPGPPRNLPAAATAIPVPAGGDTPHCRGGVGAAGAAGERRGNDPELLFTALSSLVEVVKQLTPVSGRMYANLGHEKLPANEQEEQDDDGPAPRSEVVIELLSTAGSPRPAPAAAPVAASGALGFELAVVGAIVESKGGQLSLSSPGGHSRRFVVRLPVRRSR